LKFHPDTPLKTMSNPYPFELLQRKSYRALTHGNPPYSGTIYEEANNFKDSDPTNFCTINFKATESRQCFDRRTSGWETRAFHIFIAKYSDGIKTEFRVNTDDFSREEAEEKVEYYGWKFGRIPKFLRKGSPNHDLHVCIHAGNEPWGGGYNGGLLIHTANGFDQNGRFSDIVEDILLHEAIHVSLDPVIYHTDLKEAWLEAAKKDGNYISTYARDHPLREDITETNVLVLIYLYRPERLPATDRLKIRSAVPNRIQFMKNYISDQSLEMGPMDQDHSEPCTCQSSNDCSGECIVGSLNKRGHVGISKKCGPWSPKPPSCEDNNKHCPDWAGIGECTNNPGYMLGNCELSCRVCIGENDILPPTCEDNNKHCPDWARNECTNNPGYMLENCKKSCNVCTVRERKERLFRKNWHGERKEFSRKNWRQQDRKEHFSRKYGRYDAPKIVKFQSPKTDEFKPPKIAEFKAHQNLK